VSERLSFQSDIGDAAVSALELVRVEGREALSIPYEYTLDLVSFSDQGLSREAIDAWARGTCGFSFGHGQVSGVLKEITLQPTLDAERVGYRAVLVPRLWRLSHTVRSRIFQSMKVQELVSSVLNEHRIAHQWNLLRDYPVREYTVQYAESDLAFVSRLLEHWGLFYMFEQSPDGETLVIADDNRAFVRHAEHDSLAFHAAGGDAIPTGSIGALTRTLVPGTREVIVRDYNWRASHLGEDTTMRTRQLQLRGAHAVDEQTGVGTAWRYGDHVKDEAEAKLVAQIRAEQLRVDREVYRGTLRAPGIAPGHRFQTSGMPLADLEQEYVITSIETAIEQRPTMELHAQRFTAIASSVPFRPALATPRPCIHGFMHAVVDGEVQSTAAPIDALGRYKVVMPYDVGAAPGGRASRWIRMAQPSAGSGYGMHLPLHVGTEVAIIHLDGDPDRPVIAGSIPNVDTMSPVVDANATQSRIKTRSNILFELEDDA
jgi:type VI secretion system secreted protein VgrG